MPCGLNHYDFSITSILFPAEDGSVKGKLPTFHNHLRRFIT